MMEGYSGEEIIDIKDTEYKDYKEKDWAMLYIEMYSGIDGAHHKDWLLDQLARILKGTEVIVKLAKWANRYEELRFELSEPSIEYLEFVKECKAGEDGPDTYSYEEGIAP